MGGHHGPKLPEIPDWRIYRVEDSPELMQLQKALAKHGLSDPWLRNEVWKFTANERGIGSKVLKKIVFHGFKYGAVAAVLTFSIQTLFFGHKDEKHDHH